MAERKPLVWIAGRFKVLPAGDTTRAMPFNGTFGQFTVSGSGDYWELTTASLTLNKIVAIPNQYFLANNYGYTESPGAVSPAAVKTMLGISAVTDAALALKADVIPANQPDCRLLHTAVQSVPNNVVTALTWDAESYDPMGMHSLSTNTDQIVVPYNGIYDIKANVSFGNNTTGRRGLRLTVNGTLLPGANNLIPASPTGDTTVPVSATTYLVAGDIVRAAAFQDTGAGLNLSPAGSVLSVSLLRRY